MKLKNARATDTDIHLNEKKRRKKERNRSSLILKFVVQKACTHTQWSWHTQKKTQKIVYGLESPIYGPKHRKEEETDGKI